MKKKAITPNTIVYVPADKSTLDWREEALACGPYADEEECLRLTMSAFDGWDWGDEVDEDPSAWGAMTCAKYAETLWWVAIGIGMADGYYTVATHCRSIAAGVWGKYTWQASSPAEAVQKTVDFIIGTAGEKGLAVEKDGDTYRLLRDGVEIHAVDIDDFTIVGDGDSDEKPWWELKPAADGYRYQVTCATMDADQIAGTKPYDSALTDDLLPDYVYVEEKDPELAIQLALDAIAEDIRDNCDFCDVEVDHSAAEIAVYDEDGKKVELYYNFIARLVGGDD